MFHIFIHFAQLTVNLPNTAGVGDGSIIKTILNTFFSICGAVALLVITIAGYKYVISQGSPQSIGQSKDAILYSLVGLVVIMSAFVIVNFVVFKLK